MHVRPEDPWSEIKVARNVQESAETSLSEGEMLLELNEYDPRRDLRAGQENACSETNKVRFEQQYNETSLSNVSRLLEIAMQDSVDVIGLVQKIDLYSRMQK